MEELKKDPTVHNRVRVMTLLSIDSQANKMAFREAYVIEFLVAALQDREPEVRSTAVLALQTILEKLEDDYDSLKRVHDFGRAFSGGGSGSGPFAGWYTVDSLKSTVLANCDLSGVLKKSRVLEALIATLNDVDPVV
jgi:hypothetical protein